MKLDLALFNSMFPSYNDYRIPMWSSYKEDNKQDVLEIAIPGFDKEDFILSVEGKELSLSIKTEERELHYSIMNNYFDYDHNLEAAKAEYKRGILKITIPKITKENKKIQLKVS